MSPHRHYYTMPTPFQIYPRKDVKQLLRAKTLTHDAIQRAKEKAQWLVPKSNVSTTLLRITRQRRNAHRHPLQ
jgi:hypothetical protein